jgi:hypothetical protein
LAEAVGEDRDDRLSKTSMKASTAFGSAKRSALAPIHAYAFPPQEHQHYRTWKDCDVLFVIAPDAASRQRALKTAVAGKAAAPDLVRAGGLTVDNVFSSAGMAMLRETSSGRA